MKIKSVPVVTLLTCILKVFANLQAEDLYFCTRDLDNFNSSIGSSIASSTDAVMNYYFGIPSGKSTKSQILGGVISNRLGLSSNVLPSSGLMMESHDEDEEHLQAVNRLDNWHNITFRHCFLMRAEPKEEIQLIRQGMTEKYNVLLVKNTIGFYGTGHGNDADYGQEKFKNSIYSCQKIRSFSTKLDVLDAWQDIEIFFDKEKKQGYLPLNHNCCSVAYDALKELASKGVINNNELQQINTKSFNLGLGIDYRFEPEDGFLSTIFHSSSDNILYALSPVSSEIEISDKEEKKKEEL